MAKIKTLTEFITDQQALNPGAKGDLSRLLTTLLLPLKLCTEKLTKQD